MRFDFAASSARAAHDFVVSWLVLMVLVLLVVLVVLVLLMLGGLMY